MRTIVVAKFGGTSVGTIAALERSAKIALDHDVSLVVVSACAGVTDQLVKIGALAGAGEWERAQQEINFIKARHFELAELLGSPLATYEALDEMLIELKTISKGVFYLKDLAPRAYDKILSFGERMSSVLFVDALNKLSDKKRAYLRDAREIIKTTANHTKAQPKLDDIKKQCTQYLAFDAATIFVTQGFIGSTDDGHTTTLGRGGSDASAALFAEGCGARILQIWTDVAGVATTDPNICKDAMPISEITYREAAEMAQYGAKVLHPATILPAMRAQIEIFVGSSFDAHKAGTWIKHETSNKPNLRAIAKRSHQSLLIVRTPEMLNTTGFLEKIFAAFRKAEVSVDCVTTSEISVAVTVDKNALDNNTLIADLSLYGEVSLEHGFALISLIGNRMHYTQGFGLQVFQALGAINVRMICLGASDHNFCILVAEHQVDEAIKKLHAYFVGTENI